MGVDVLADMTRYDAARLHLLIARHARFAGSRVDIAVEESYRNMKVILDRHPAVRHYRLADERSGSWGATLVELRSPAG